MKIPKLIHVLLIALLCYSNLVASVHVVGHMHLHEGSGTGSVSLDNHWAAHGHDGIDSAHHASEHDHSTHRDGDNNTEKDCAIYHALLSLSGVLCTARHGVTAPLQLSANTAYASTHIAGATPNHQQIRAPPAHS